jgi:hypothetical protein
VIVHDDRVVVVAGGARTYDADLALPSGQRRPGFSSEFSLVRPLAGHPRGRVTRLPPRSTGPEGFSMPRQLARPFDEKSRGLAHDRRRFRLGQIPIVRSDAVARDGGDLRAELAFGGHTQCHEGG